MRRHSTPNDPIVPEQRLAITLRFLAGGQALDLVDIAPTALTTIYAIVWDTMRAMNSCKSLDFRSFDISLAACQDRATWFQKRCSVPDIFDKVVGAVDGLFIRISSRSQNEHPNPRSFYSGHKKGHGINLQVVCDAFCRVLDVSFQCPGTCLRCYVYCLLRTWFDS